MTTHEKPLLTMRELVADLVPDGQEVLIGGFAFADPTAFGHELIRQGRRELRILKTSGGVLVDQLLGAGCVSELVFAHVWNSVGPVATHAFRRAIESGVPHRPAYDELSYGAFTMALFAAAHGLPFMPSTPAQGTTHFKQRQLLPDKYAVIDSPFGGEPVTLVAPLRPELGVFHVQQADRFGNAQIFGPLGETKLAMLACARVVVIAEQIVSTDVIRERPEATVIPGFCVEAIVHEPWSAHPSDAYGYYGRDLAHHEFYGVATRTEEGFREYMAEYILATETHEGFLRKLGPEYLRGLMLRDDPWW